MFCFVTFSREMDSSIFDYNWKEVSFCLSIIWDIHSSCDDSSGGVHDESQLRIFWLSFFSSNLDYWKTTCGEDKAASLVSTKNLCCFGFYFNLQLEHIS